MVNESLVRDLLECGLWSDALRNEILRHNGSVQGIKAIPVELRNLYKIAWDMSNSVYIDMAADRGPFVCQSQSLNLYLAEPSRASLSSMHMYAWRKGLKTGVYYLHTKPATDPIKFTAAAQVGGDAAAACPRDCLSCSA